MSIPAALDEVAYQLGEVERRLVDGAPLWVREYSAIALRASRSAIHRYAHMPMRVRSVEQLDAAKSLWARCDALEARMGTLDSSDFDALRAELVAGTYTPERFVTELRQRPEYEWDVFTHRLLAIDDHPRRKLLRDKNMVHYQASPTRAVLELADSVGPWDVVYDLGAGLGKVTLIVGWLTGAIAKGVEYDPAYCELMQARASQFNFRTVEVVNADARDVDYSDGSVFYFYNPFEGPIMAAVLESLRAVAERRPIRLFSIGKSSFDFKATPWLEHVGTTPGQMSVFVPTSSVVAGA